MTQRQLTDEDYDYYIKTGNCPYCHKETDISYGSIDIDAGVVYQEAHCPECDARWQDTYEQSGIYDEVHEHTVFDKRLKLEMD